MGWIIVGGIFAAILLLSLGRVTVIFDYKDDLILTVKYLFIPIMKIPADKPKKEKKPKKSAKKKDEAEKTEEKPKKKLELADILEVAKLAVNSVGKPLKKIIKRTIIEHLSLNISVGGEDAAKTAISFGAANFAVGSALGWLDTFFTLKKPDDINITADFASEETKIDCYCEIKLVLAAGIAFFFTFVGRAIKYYFTHDRARASIRHLV